MLSNTTQVLMSLLALFGMFFLCECSKSTTVDHEYDESEFIELNSQNQVVFLGIRASGDSSWIKFTYKFKMLRHEITLKQFQGVMGYYPISQPPATKDDLPVTGLNLYEATFFCNALSKAAGLDTVFSYTDVIRDASGRLKYVENLSADLSKDGYRLPTEAEWNFAAGGNEGNVFPWGKDSIDFDRFAWTSENSPGMLRPIEGKDATNAGFYDLAGNALEMVWGWFGSLSKDTLTNFAGTAVVEGNEEIPVKGGSAFHSGQFAKLQSRKDVYSIYADTRLKYLGFRIARGVIPKATYTNPDGEIVEGPTFSIASSRQQLLDFFGTDRVALAFVDNTSKKLTTVNFKYSTPVINTNGSNVKVANPSISPDGMYIAFGTRVEGQSGKSEAYVVPFLLDSVPSIISTHSAFKPRWHRNASSGEWNIIVADSGVNNGDSIRWEKGKTYAISWPSKTERVIAPAGSFHSGLSQDDRYLVTGYTRLLRDDLQNGRVEELFLSPKNGKDVDGSTQVCNVSLRPDSSSEILFLDFGYPRKSSIIGKAYGIHEVLFSANVETGEVVKAFNVPIGYMSWDFSVWSTNPDFIIASVVDDSEYHTAIYAIRYHDGAVLKLVEGTDMVMPHLWVDTAAADSSLIKQENYGRYGVSGISENSAWSAKMQKYWAHYDSADAFILGTSREWTGINPHRMHGYRALDLAAPGIGPQAGIYFARDYLLGRAKPPRLIIVGIGPEFMSNIFLPMYQLSLSTTPGYLVDQYHNFWKDSLPDAIQEILVANSNLGGDQFYFLDSLGFHPNTGCTGWGDAIFNIDATWEEGASSWMNGWLNLKGFVNDATAEGIKVVTVILPMNPKYQNTPYYSRHGGLRNEVLAFLDSVKTLEKGNLNFRHLDFHHDGNHDFTDVEAFDADHLCYFGAHRVTDSIMARIKDWN